VHNAGQSIIVSLMRLIHITDPHLSTLDGLSFLKLKGKRRSGYLSWFKNRRFEHRREVLDRLTEAISLQEPDLILVTGDLVHIGLEQEMAEAAQWLRSLGTPERVVLVPGNHDNYADDSLAYKYRLWGDYLPGHEDAGDDYTAGYPFERGHGRLKLTGVNTSCVTRIFSATGELGSRQREKLKQSLDRKPGENDFHCLMIHHPPLPGITQSRKALKDASELGEIIRRKQPDLVLYGHIHCNREDPVGQTRIYCTASASSADDASYRMFDLNEAGSGWHCRMQLMTLDRTAGTEQFRLASEHSWQTPACENLSNIGQ
jgi:3',5'-cyclic AMP phosphodiesterase CpdA